MELTCEVFIEISKGSHIKYEYDEARKILICDRILHTPFKYEFNYGFIPKTLSDDGDPLDVIVVMNDSLVPGSLIKCKFLGMLDTTDDKGGDPKIIMSPCDEVDPLSRELHDLNDLNEVTLQRIKYFFQHYKDLENKKVCVGEFRDKSDAIETYHKSKTITKKCVDTFKHSVTNEKFINIFPICATAPPYHLRKQEEPLPPCVLPPPIFTRLTSNLTLKTNKLIHEFQTNK
jgi:inorganic pyrophosphatase